MCSLSPTRRQCYRQMYYMSVAKIKQVQTSLTYCSDMIMLIPSTGLLTLAVISTQFLTNECDSEQAGEMTTKCIYIYIFLRYLI